jgi:hypothetical protein
MVDEIVHRINDIIQFLESSVQCGYNSFAEESPLMSVRLEHEWMSIDYEGEGFAEDDNDWDGMNRNDINWDSDLCMYWDEINDRQAN